jgi:hypothetical protein
MESLQSPEGLRLDWAVGTTYTLDLLALLTAPVAFAFSEWQDPDGRPHSDPLALLKAVREYADRICIFHEPGKTQVPKTYQPMLEGLEGAVIAVKSPKGGVFHPKLWFLRFVAPENEMVRYRVLCVSRNMTFDRSWDTLLCLEGELQERVNAINANHPLGQFVEALPGMSINPLSPQWKKRISQLAREIRRVAFELPEQFDELAFHPLGITTGEDAWPFPERIQRLFVISPFVGDGLLEDLQEWQAPIQLLSRAEQLARLQPATLQALDKVWILDDTANPEPGDTEEDVAAEPSSDQPVAASELPLVGLHAKVYVAETGATASVFTGSANATRSAFNRNVEFFVELRGKKKKCGIDALLGQASEESRKQASCLAALLQPYLPPAVTPTIDQELDDFERQVDALAKELATAGPVAQCEPGTSDNTFKLRIVCAKPLKPHRVQEVAIRMRPVSLAGHQLAEVNPTQATWAEFGSLSLLGLTSFFAFEVESLSLKTRRQFVLNLPLQNAPQNRHEAILRDLLSDRDRVLRFLLLLLTDSGAKDLCTLTGGSPNGEPKSSWIHAMLGSTLFESLLKALDRDPQRLDQVAHVIRDLQQSEEGKTLLPADLDTIWKPIWEARRLQLDRLQRSRK